MDTFELRRKMKTCLPSHHTYVCAIDQLKYIADTQFCLIVNTDLSNKKGEHWFAIFKSNTQKYIDIFDSFGVDLNRYHKDLIKFIKRCGGKIRYNNKQYQSNYSDTCGMFCVYFLYKRGTAVRYETILSTFSETDLKYNDQFVKTFVDNIQFKIPGKVCECKLCQFFSKYRCQVNRKCYLRNRN